MIVTDIATDPFWDDFRALAEKAGVAACWSTPILARDGSLLGTFAMYHRAPRAPQDADLALARDFADTAALGIERHQAEQARKAAQAREKAARDDLAFLLDASTSLSTDLDATQALKRLADSCAPTLAPLCAVDIVEGGRVVRVAAAAPTQGQQELLASHIPVYDDADDAVARVLTSGTSEVARRTPTGPGPWHDLGVTGYLCVPLIDRGSPFGAMTLLSTGDHTFDGHTVALAEELARRAASAARNARQYTYRAALARDLQAGLLLLDVPDVPGADVATYYHPVGEGLDIGGDFYDIFDLEDGRWAFLLGDVSGRGAIAATTTALVRHTARAVAPLLPGPTDVVKAINRALTNRPASHGTGFVTLVYGQLAPTTTGLDIELVRAGHTLPMHLDTHHTVHPLEAPGLLLGVTTDPHLTPPPPTPATPREPGPLHRRHHRSTPNGQRTVRRPTPHRRASRHPDPAHSATRHRHSHPDRVRLHQRPLPCLRGRQLSHLARRRRADAGDLHTAGPGTLDGRSRCLLPQLGNCHPLRRAQDA